MMQNKSVQVVPAVYREHLDTVLNNNPLTEALSVMLKREEVIKKLHKPHPTANDFTEFPSFYKKTQINHFRKVVSPHPHSFYMYHKFMELILCGYVDRNPFQPNYLNQRTTIGENAIEGVYDDNLNLSFSISSAPSCVVTGISGTSKTTTVRSVLSLIPQVIEHESFHGKPFQTKQLTYVSFDCAASKSPKALALSFFAAVDAVLNTQYFKIWEKRSKESVERFYANMQLVAAKHHIGLIHIDEVQFFLKHITSADSPNLTVIESLFNKIGIPVVLSCTLEGLELFEPIPSKDPSKYPDMTTTRRMLDEREFDFGAYSLGSDEFNKIFTDFFPDRICRGSVPKDVFKAEFHRLTVGIPAIINRLARLHHEQVTIKKKKTDDIEILNQVYRSQFRHIDFALEQLRMADQTASPNETQLKNYEEALPRDSKGNAVWEVKKTGDNDKPAVVHQVPDIPEYGEPEDNSHPIDDDNFESGF
ncbi:ATP-binding protein [Pseudoalteromonas sp. bablab_jr004]|uniref:ATP-binding protein n=1 Tax=Pseudoalteromonas sp. bablab_jr004 TaxID=2755065 RepID=UPI0018F34F4A|nr:ATP-binding protein [Pseudoalteromonas sp. bablab_jr004]